HARPRSRLLHERVPAAALGTPPDPARALRAARGAGKDGLSLARHAGGSLQRREGPRAGMLSNAEEDYFRSGASPNRLLMSSSFQRIPAPIITDRFPEFRMSSKPVCTYMLGVAFQRPK